ncbi:hypothetical protein HDF16_003818 [Granulicella aggregans]|uniref:Uncharacterized protein n=1 Tax=Granulicella aggregans TaxID=474949 RepID=A0A7W7ZFQ5_9BACT|nr:hypothetical protein [Granulicella aggregans]MBB5059095.1 hypothetical protein [Granulicella aggregans]
MPELTFTVAVFAQADQLILVGLEHDDAERAVSDAVARGYAFAGSIAVVANEPKVVIEPGYAATMALAGAVFAEMLGKQIQETSRRSHVEL